jgi:prevent-host-death family protein
MKRVSVAEAKNRLPALLHEAAESGPIEIFRHDQPVAVIVAHAEFARLQRGRRKRQGTFAAVMKWREKYREELEELDLAGALAPARDQRPARPVKW